MRGRNQKITPFWKLLEGRIFKKKSEIPQNDLTKPNIEGQVCLGVTRNRILSQVKNVKNKSLSAQCSQYIPYMRIPKLVNYSKFLLQVPVSVLPIPFCPCNGMERSVSLSSETVLSVHAPSDRHWPDLLSTAGQMLPGIDSAGFLSMKYPIRRSGALIFCLVKQNPTLP